MPHGLNKSKPSCLSDPMLCCAVVSPKMMDYSFRRQIIHHATSWRLSLSWCNNRPWSNSHAAALMQPPVEILRRKSVPFENKLRRK